MGTFCVLVFLSFRIGRTADILPTRRLTTGRYDGTASMPRDARPRFFDSDLKLASAALDSCRATTLVVGDALAGRLPSEPEVAAMGDAALHIYAVLETIQGP